MDNRRSKPLDRGLPGRHSIDLGSLSQGSTIEWDATLEKWVASTGGGGAISAYGGLYNSFTGETEASAARLAGLNNSTSKVLANANLALGTIWTTNGGTWPKNGTASGITTNATNGTITLDSEGLWLIFWGAAVDRFAGSSPIFRLWLNIDAGTSDFAAQLASTGAWDGTMTGIHFEDTTGGGGGEVLSLSMDCVNTTATAQIWGAYLFALKIG